MQEPADRKAALNKKPADATEASAKERAVTAALRRITAELDLELGQAREELGRSGKVARLPAPRRPARR
ncbi:hypothetical protein ACH4A3_11025 [Streptomyces sp. NPDC018007]|uniref:hypothetical protein n=1 Tax=Streptomyces sp. NPDC018007 TaxID=3365029 RepID=UPI0037B53A6E